MTLSDTWERGASYNQFVGRWSRRVAPLFLSWLNIPGGQRWLDVGCGTGALCAAILDHCSPATVAGVEPSAGFLKTAQEHLAGRVELRQGSAAMIPLPDNSVDVVVSGLVMNFVPDQRAAIAEMVRVSCNGGVIAAYVWDDAAGMEFLRFFWDAAIELDPGAAIKDEGSRFLVCRREGLAELFAGAGLKQVESTKLDIITRFAGFDDYWQPFLGGQGPAPNYVMSLDEAARARLRENLRRRLPVQTDGTIQLTARAWAARAVVAK